MPAANSFTTDVSEAMPNRMNPDRGRESGCRSRPAEIRSPEEKRSVAGLAQAFEVSPPTAATVARWTPRSR